MSINTSVTGQAASITFPPELPVSAVRDEIAAAITAHQVVIVAGETGSGKTTQLPKIALALGRQSIAHTQPRRIAARAVAERIAHELGENLGALVGYQVRFTDVSSKHTRIKLLTDGILLNEIHRDRLLRSYDTIIIDEAHERSLNIDFLLGYLRTLLPKRPDLKVIITSATIDPESFAAHFANAPIISVSGRSWPVEVRYRPLLAEQPALSAQPPSPRGARGERDLYEATGDALEELLQDTPGNVLAFFAGEGEIKDAAEYLTGRFANARLPGARELQVLPLYGRLSQADQHRIFTPTQPGIRRVVLATNVAETSLTVPEITGVIDSGTARISRFAARSKVQRLPIEAISKASATQRAGRAGRLSAGVAIRLYSQEDFQVRPEFTDPEILRTGLAAVLLKMLSLGLGDIKNFPFLTPPDARGVRDGLALLTELGAVKDGKITDLGRALARIPLEPRFGRMVLEAVRHGVTEQVIALVAGLTVADVREYPAEQRDYAAQLHARFHDPLGDLHTLLNLYNYLREIQQELGSSAFRRRLKAEHLNVIRVREWFDLVSQLRRALKDLRLPKELTKPRRSAPADPAKLVLYCALSGLLSHLGVRDEKRISEAQQRAARHGGKAERRVRASYLGSRGSRFVLHPGSTLAGHPPETVMSVELVETSRLFARQNSAVEPEWAEELAARLCKRTHSDPAWSRKLGAAVITERVSLYGVPIVAGRTVRLSRIDAQAARSMFIASALVAGDWRHSYPFEKHNRALRQELQDLAAQSRSRALLDDADAVFAFFDKRLPAHVTGATDFVAWWTRAGSKNPRLLHLGREDLLPETTAEPQLDAAEFPSSITLGQWQLGIKYRFAPAAPDDGITVTLPLPLLPEARPEAFSNLVPGMREELLAALLKTLPKQIRKHVAPVSVWAKKLLPEIAAQLAAEANAAEPTPITELVAPRLRRLAQMPVTAADFDVSRLPAHLRPTYRIVDAKGRVLDSGKDLAALKRKHAGKAAASRATASTSSPRVSNLSRKNLTLWPQDLPEIPRAVTAGFATPNPTGTATPQAAGSVRAYPCMVRRRAHVDLVLEQDQHQAEALHRLGVSRLVQLSSPPITEYVRDHLTQQEKLLLTHSPYRDLPDLISDVALALAAECVREINPTGLIYSRAEFEQAAERFAVRSVQDSFAVVSKVAAICDKARQAAKAIAATTSITVLPLASDAKAQLEHLFFATGSGSGFISRTGLGQLSRLPVYFDAITHRMRQLPANQGRDRAALTQVETITGEFLAAGGQLPLPETAPAHLTEARWMLEELRISVFAQHLGCAQKVSPQRIRAVLAAR